MPAGDYIPQFKTGYTVFSNGDSDENREYIVVSTHRGLGRFSESFRHGHSDYDERDQNHTLYAIYDPLVKTTCWRWEYGLKLYCCNASRGKKILLEECHLKYMVDNYGIYGKGFGVYVNFLKEP